MKFEINSEDAQTLYEKYSYIIYSSCIKILACNEATKDAVQEIFIKLFKKYPYFKNQEHIVPWIYRVTKNHCLNVLRNEKKLINDIDMDCFAGQEDHEEKFINKQFIHQLIKTYNKRVQDAVYYTYIEGMNQEEIHEITGQSPVTIRRNLRHFKESLERKGIRQS